MHSQGDDPSEHDEERYKALILGTPHPRDMAHPDYVAAMQRNATSEWQEYEDRVARERYERRLRILQWVLIGLAVGAFVAYAGSR
jgi:hypothetical protein